MKFWSIKNLSFSRGVVSQWQSAYPVEVNLCPTDPFLGGDNIPPLPFRQVHAPRSHKIHPRTHVTLTCLSAPCTALPSYSISCSEAEEAAWEKGQVKVEGKEAREVEGGLLTRLSCRKKSFFMLQNPISSTSRVHLVSRS